MLRQVAAHGRWSEPRCIYVSKSNHWVNSGPHVPLPKGGEAVEGLATLCTCQRTLRWQLWNMDRSRGDRSRGFRGVYVVLVGAASAPTGRWTQYPHHGREDWQKLACGRILAILRLEWVMQAVEAKRQYPHRLDLGRYGIRGGRRTKGAHDRFALASPATIAAPVAGSIAYRIFPLAGADMVPVPAKLWRKLRPRRPPMRVEPGDALWYALCKNVELAWKSATRA